MNILTPTPYISTRKNHYTVETKILIDNSAFLGITYKEGASTFFFESCRFKKLVIEVSEELNFKHVYIYFYHCFIEEVYVEIINSNNVSISFGSSVLEGVIKSPNLLNVDFNNCIIGRSIFLIQLQNVSISYTEENIYLFRWRRLLKSINATFQDLFTNNLSYFISDCKIVVYSFNENKTDKTGIYEIPYDRVNRFGYILTEEERKNLKISLNISYSSDNEHKSTKIINAKLASLTLNGYSTGEVTIENSEIDCWYLNNFTSQFGSNFYNIRPYRKHNTNKLEIHKSNLDKVWFDNISFNEYPIISLFRNKFGQTTFTACDFPIRIKDFEKIHTIENIHNPNKRDRNYFKTRYETFLQIKKQLENSGNFYEAQKFMAVSNEALREIEDLEIWDKFILRFNSMSNNHGISIKEPLIGTIIISVIFYLLYLSSIGRLFNGHSVDWNLIGYYFSFLDITHRSDFLVDKNELNGFSLTIDYFHKIIVGFLIYQFIAAFRKYGKK